MVFFFFKQFYNIVDLLNFLNVSCLELPTGELGGLFNKQIKVKGKYQGLGHFYFFPIFKLTLLASKVLLCCTIFFFQNDGIRVSQPGQL